MGGNMTYVSCWVGSFRGGREASQLDTGNMSLQAFSLDVSSMVEHIYNKPVSSLSLTSCLTRCFQELVGNKATFYSIDNSTSQSVRNIYIQVRVAPIFFLIHLLQLILPASYLQKKVDHIKMIGQHKMAGS